MLFGVKPWHVIIPVDVKWLNYIEPVIDRLGPVIELFDVKPFHIIGPVYVPPHVETKFEFTYDCVANAFPFQ